VKSTTSILTLSVLSLSLSLGCGQNTPPSTGGPNGPATVQTLLEGRLYGALRGTPRRVEVVDLLGGVAGPQRCETTSERDGKWSCDLGALFGDFIVKVDTGAGAPMQAVVDGVEQGKTKNVVVSPFTHLTAAYLEARLARDEPLDLALAAARRLVHGHFGGIRHHRVSPEDVSESLGSVLSETLVSGFLVVGLEALAADIAEANGQGAGGSINVWRLLAALAADVRADGVFDGQGPQGTLRLGETALDGNTLRADYGRALLAWVESERNTTSFERSDFESLASRLANNVSELFPEDVPDPLDDTAPMILSVEVASDPADPVAQGTPLSGPVFVTVEARDPSGLASFSLTESTGADVVDAGEPQGQTGHRWRIDGPALEDGLHVFELVVVDGAANEATQNLEVLIDNTAPTLSASAAGRSRSSTVAVSGEVTDAVGPVASVAISVLGQPTQTLEAPEQFWSAVVDLACDGQDHTIEVRAKDAAGNEASTLVQAGCDNSAPSLQVQSTTYYDGMQVEATYAPDGQTLTYLPVAFPTPTEINSEGPHQFVKYFTRLDAWSPDLPVLSVVTGDDRGQEQVTVQYRYLVNDVLVRGWSTAETMDRLEWSVPVSYQHLGTELATAGSSATHRVEMRSSDAAGNRAQLAFTFTMTLRSPPVWLGGCQVHPTLQGYGLSQGNLHEVFRVRAATPVLAGSLRYALDVSRQSLAPQGTVRVRALDAGARTYVESIRLDGHAKPSVERVPWAGASDILCGPDQHRLWVGALGTGSNLGCRAGVLPLLGQPWRTRAVDGLLNDDLAHLTSTSLSIPGGAVRVDGSYFVVEPERVHSLDVHIENPVLRVDTQTYTWPTALGLPAGYVANGSGVRYRGFAQWQGEGADIFAHWLGGANAGVDARRFVTRPYISGVSFEMQPVQLEVLHSDLDVVVPVQVTPQCETALQYTTSL